MVNYANIRIFFPFDEIPFLNIFLLDSYFLSKTKKVCIQVAWLVHFENPWPHVMMWYSVCVRMTLDR